MTRTGAQADDGASEIAASVLVGSVNGGEWIHHLLRALDAQEGEVPFEVVVADRCADGTAERIEEDHPNVVLVRCPPDTTLPRLRAAALRASRGAVIFVVEDHVVPPSGWVAMMSDALSKAPEKICAVGGPVDNAMRERAVDWAAFLCEYSAFLPPLPAGEVDDAPGMNVAYRREALESSTDEDLEKGFWESTVHPRLREEGRGFLRLADAVMMHRKRFGFAYFLSQRYHYSRYYAGIRFGAGHAAKRLVYAALSPTVLPPLLLLRMARNVWAKPPFRGPLLRALPAIAVFVVAWGVGEAVGYLAGPGDSLVRIE